MKIFPYSKSEFIKSKHLKETSYLFAYCPWWRFVPQKRLFDKAVIFSHPHADIGLKYLKEIPLVSLRLPTEGYLQHINTYIAGDSFGSWGQCQILLRRWWVFLWTADHWCRKTYNKSFWNLFTVELLSWHLFVLKKETTLSCSPSKCYIRFFLFSFYMNTDLWALATDEIVYCKQFSSSQIIIFFINYFTWNGYKTVAVFQQKYVGTFLNCILNP